MAFASCLAFRLAMARKRALDAETGSTATGVDSGVDLPDLEEGTGETDDFCRFR